MIPISDESLIGSSTQIDFKVVLDDYPNGVYLDYPITVNFVACTVDEADVTIPDLDDVQIDGAS